MPINQKRLSSFVLTRESQITGNMNSMEFPGELMDAINEWLDKPRGARPHVQNAFPQLSPDHREFLITGMTPGEWDDLFG